MVNPYRPEQAEAEITRQEAIRQQELERRLSEAEAADSGKATAAMTRTEGEAMRTQLGDRPTAARVNAEVRLREVERSEMLEKATPHQADVAKPTDQQMQEATEAIRDVQELRPEVWRGLDDAQRLEVLREVESRMAEIQGRPPVEVKVEPMEPGVYGGYNREDGIVRISQEHLRSNKPEEVLDTVVHEGRHAYQHYAVEHPGFHPNQAEVEAWDWNTQSGHYLRPEIVGQRAYVQQPVEADAWAYAGRIVRNVMGGPR
jgi:hypothetical protein